MASIIHRHGTVAHLPDERIVADIDIECAVSPETPDTAVDVKVDIVKRGGIRFSKHFVLPADISYNLPHYLRHILRETGLESDDLTSPLLTRKGQSSAMVISLLDALAAQLSHCSDGVNIDRYLSHHL